MQPDAILVVGMHRSGTSVIARALKAIGVALGDDLIAPNEYNLKGHWEDRAVVEFNEKVLAALGHTWNSLRPIEPSQWETPEVDKLRTEAAELIQERFGQFPLWGVKDPRLCRLLGFWQPVFQNLGTREAYVISIRNPLSVARSLQNRDGFPLEKSYLLWLQHILSTLGHTHGKPRVIVDFDDVMEDPFLQVRRIAEELDIPGNMADRESFDQFSKDFLDDALRHARSTPDDLRGNENAPCLVREIYEYLRHLARDSVSLDDVEVIHRCGLFQKRSESIAPFLHYMGELEARPARPPLQAQLFIDTGSGFNEEESSIKPISADTSRLIFNMDGISPVHLRFDPANTYATIQLLSIVLGYSDSTEFRVCEYASNGMRDGDNLMFDTEDPQIYFDPQADKPISQCRIEISYRILGHKAEADTLRRKLDHTTAQVEEARREIARREQEAVELAATVERQVEIIRGQTGRISEQAGIILEHEGRIGEQRGLIAEQEGRITEQQGLITEQQGLITEQEGLITEQQGLITEQEGLITEQEGLITEQEGLITEQQGRITEQAGMILEHAGRITELAIRISEQDGMLSEQGRIIEGKRLEAEKYKSIIAAREEQLLHFLRLTAASAVFRSAMKKFSLLSPLRAVSYYRTADSIIRRGLFDYRFYMERNPDVVHAGIHPLVHFLDFGASELRDPNPLFDISYYLRTNPKATLSKMNPLAHYLKHGACAMFDPHPLFDTSYYLENNADVAGSGMNPLVHFIQYGGKEGRNPHPLFDTSYYLENNSDVAGSGMNPLVHFIQYGGKEGRNPHPLFETCRYIDANPDVADTGINPLVHFVQRGGEYEYPEDKVDVKLTS